MINLPSSEWDKTIKNEEKMIQFVISSVYIDVDVSS